MTGVERAKDHPKFEMGENAITSYAAPSRGSTENILFRAELPPGGALPRHHHDHLDVFVVVAGSGTMVIGDESMPVQVGDSVVVPTGEWHYLEAGDQGCQIIVTMDVGTLFIREDGSRTVPAWGE